jgi:hypothetical protein
MPKIDYPALAAAALNQAETLLADWLPGGRRRDGREWKALNPTRVDGHEGSFSVNVDTGAWADFTTGDKGGDLIALCAYFFHGGNQKAAYTELAARLGYPFPSSRGTGRPRSPNRAETVQTGATSTSTTAPEKPARRSPGCRSCRFPTTPHHRRRPTSCADGPSKPGPTVTARAASSAMFVDFARRMAGKKCCRSLGVITKSPGNATGAGLPSPSRARSTVSIAWRPRRSRPH